MATLRRGLAAPSLPAVALLVGAVCLAACASQGPRGYQNRVANALPESDPSSRGTVQGARVLSEVEQVVVRMGRDADGRIVVLQVLSPVLTPEQQEEVRRAFAVGGYQREAPLPKQDDSWIETLRPSKP